MGYVNPIPHPDDEYQSAVWSVTFTFEETATKSEALEGINRVIAENGGKIDAAWLMMGQPRNIRYVQAQPK